MKAKFLEIDAQRPPKQKQAFASGVKVAFGTDAGVYAHGLNAREFKNLVDYGLTPIQAIQLRHAQCCRPARRSDKLGAIEPGKFADIVAVDTDPLKDIGALQEVAVVMKGGRVHKERPKQYRQVALP